MNLSSFFSILLVLHLAVLIPNHICVESRKMVKEFIHGDDDKASQGTRWAVLLAGSDGYGNYRHQASVCHAYQVLKKGGLKDENIIVFMYDDIAFDESNPRPGVLINNPRGEDVYYGVPKDYIGDDINVNNFLNVLLGNKSAITGNGSGKVVSSGPNDTIFVYYVDHGSPGLLLMPGTSKYLYANELNDALIKKHESGTYKSMVMYVEACYSGSMFEGLLKPGMNIYVTTAANANESSYAYYCPGHVPNPPAEYTTCLGSLYSIAWLEDSEKYNMKTETLEKQYAVVKRRTMYENVDPAGSHVTQYGDIKQLSNQSMYTYIGTNPDNEEYTNSQKTDSKPVQFLSHSIIQRDADLIHFRLEYQNAPEGSEKKTKALQRYQNALQYRSYVDGSMNLIGEFLFGSVEKSSNVMKAVRPAGQPLVDDWSCYKTM
ncbi:hypothetical protein MKW94_008376, partial [Papaver nudicaule]|nr:hypothetical protein [Papaver nudicaule]